MKAFFLVLISCHQLRYNQKTMQIVSYSIQHLFQSNIGTVVIIPCVQIEQLHMDYLVVQ